MNISERGLQRFTQAYQKEFGVLLTNDEAEVMMLECLQLLELLGRPLHSSKSELLGGDVTR